MIKKEPQLDWTKVIGILCIYLGFLLFLVAFHIVAIDNTGDVSSVMSTVFSVFIMIYSGAIIFGFAGLVIHLLRWLAYKAQTPKWLQAEQRGSK